MKEDKDKAKVDLKNFRREDLLLVGGLVWMIMGSIMIFLGYRQMIQDLDKVLIYFLIAVGVFYASFVYIFRNLTKRYTDRIKNRKEETLAVWKVFNVEGYLMMAVLVIAGFYIGELEELNPIWWAPIYIGLGLTLVVSGAMYWIGYMRERLTFGKTKK